MKSQNENSSTDQKKTNNKRYAFAQRQGDDFRNYIGDILVECVEEQLAKGQLQIDE